MYVETKDNIRNITFLTSGNVEGATTSRYAVASGLTVSAGDGMRVSPKSPSIGTALATGVYA